jgi:hypothetical protein
MRVKMGGLIELCVLVIVGLGSIIEGLRLTGLKLAQFDPLGPGRYNIGVGIILIFVSVLYFIGQRKKEAKAPKGATQKAAGDQTSADKQKAYTIMMVSIIAIMAIYALLISWIGYLFASAVFFLLINRAVGVRSWVVNLASTAILTASYYLIFVKWMGMMFPHGIGL